MKLKVLRDIGIILVVCVALYVVTWTTSIFSTDVKTEYSNELSPERHSAALHLSKENYVEAAEDFESLVERDPFDSHAWFHVAYCAHKVHRSNQAKLANENSDSARGKKLEETSKIYADKAIKAYEQACEFSSYRGQSLYNLAVLYHNQKIKTEKVYEYLRESIDEGFFVRGGIQNRGDFADLLEDPEFQKIIKKERDAIASRRWRQRRIRGAGG